MARRYQSAVRDERANRTRTALLDACEALLLEVPVEQVTLPAVARRAGVTKPTAYGYFPDHDALLAGFLEHLRDRIGMEHELLAAIAPKQLPVALRENYRRFDQNAALLRRIMDSPSYERVRLSRKLDRAGKVLPNWHGVTSERLLRQRLGPIYMLLAPASWRWLCDTWGLSGEQAANAAAWAAQALIAALPASTSQPPPKTRRPVSRPKKEK